MGSHSFGVPAVAQYCLFRVDGENCWLSALVTFLFQETGSSTASWSFALLEDILWVVWLLGLGEVLRPIAGNYSLFQAGRQYSRYPGTSPSNISAFVAAILQIV